MDLSEGESWGEEATSSLGKGSHKKIHKLDIPVNRECKKENKSYKFKKDTSLI